MAYTVQQILSAKYAKLHLHDPHVHELIIIACKIIFTYLSIKYQILGTKRSIPGNFSSAKETPKINHNPGVPLQQYR